MALKIGSMSDVLTDPPHRLIANVEGDEKSGKNHFAFSAPWPLAYFNVGDRDNTRLLEHWAGVKKKPFVSGYYPVPGEDRILIEKDQKILQQTANEARPIWRRFHDDYYAVLRDKTIRTIVVDTGGALKTLINLCKFGRILKNVDPQLRAQAKLDFMNIIYRARATDKNLILIHRLKAEWEKKRDGSFPNQTGEKVIAGYQEDVPFEVDLSIRCVKDRKNKSFSVTIQDCGVGFEGAQYIGDVFEDKEARFRYVAAHVWGDSPKDWI